MCLVLWQVIFKFLLFVCFETLSPYGLQADLELLASEKSFFSACQVAEATGVDPHA